MHVVLPLTKGHLSDKSRIDRWGDLMRGGTTVFMANEVVFQDRFYQYKHADVVVYISYTCI